MNKNIALIFSLVLFCASVVEANPSEGASRRGSMSKEDRAARRAPWQEKRDAMTPEELVDLKKKRRARRDAMTPKELVVFQERRRARRRAMPEEDREARRTR